MSLGNVPMKAGGGGAKWSVSLKQGTQVSIATQGVATTTWHSHTERLINFGNSVQLHLSAFKNNRDIMNTYG